MWIENVVTIASQKTQLELIAMERSLRATGCDLPLRVIPYDDSSFSLPKNATWWRDDALCAWLAEWKTIPVMRKYQCLLTENYQFVDTDVIFLKNPVDELDIHSGWITSCGHWHNPQDTQTPATQKIFEHSTTNWAAITFNTGQFASDRVVFENLEALKAIAEDPRYKDACLQQRFHEQPGMNTLVLLSGVPLQNLTLPPTSMESTWANDYDDADFTRYWKDEARKPYLLHWAGRKPNGALPIDQLFLNFLTDAEKRSYLEMQRTRTLPFYTLLTQRLRRSWRAFRAPVQ
jgi:hypothetical protein